MNKKYEIVNWCFLPQTQGCGYPYLCITIRPDDYLMPDLQRSYMSGLKGMIGGTNSPHDGNMYTVMFDKVLFTDNDYMGMIINSTTNVLPPQNGFIMFKIPNIPLNYLF